MNQFISYSKLDSINLMIWLKRISTEVLFISVFGEKKRFREAGRKLVPSSVLHNHDYLELFINEWKNDEVIDGSILGGCVGDSYEKSTGLSRTYCKRITAKPPLW